VDLTGHGPVRLMMFGIQKGPARFAAAVTIVVAVAAAIFAIVATTVLLQVKSSRQIKDAKRSVTESAPQKVAGR
jgi:hypothetical protein